MNTRLHQAALLLFIISLAAGCLRQDAPGAGGARPASGPGVTDSEIKIGSVMPYSGPASSYATIGRAQAAYFRMINDQGGIHGRKINLVSLDGAYSPPKTVEMTRRLIEHERVLLLFSVLGTAVNVAIQKYANDARVPHLFLATGASRWNEPAAFPWTMGWLPDYRTEAGVYAAHILRQSPDARIGVLYQNDDYGRDYLHGFKAALGAKARLVAEIPYEVTSATVDSEIVQLKASGANVFFNVSTPKFAAQAIRKAHDIGWHPTQYLNSVAASISAVLEPAGVAKAKGIISAHFMKDPTDPGLSGDAEVEAWTVFMRKYYPEGSLSDAFNVTGYTMAATLVHVLDACGNDLSRENVMKQAASLKDFRPPMLLPEIRLNTSATDYAPIETLELRRVDGKQWVPLNEGTIAARRS